LVHENTGSLVSGFFHRSHRPAKLSTWPSAALVVLDKADIGTWLKGKAGTELLEPAAKDRLRMWPVSRRVNKTGTGDDDPTLLDEVAA
jgi:hypothetical protein